MRYRFPLRNPSTASRRLRAIWSIHSPSGWRQIPATSTFRTNAAGGKAFAAFMLAMVGFGLFGVLLTGAAYLPLDPAHPATLSKPTVTGILRERLVLARTGGGALPLQLGAGRVQLLLPLHLETYLHVDEVKADAYGLGMDQVALATSVEKAR